LCRRVVDGRGFGVQRIRAGGGFEFIGEAVAIGIDGRVAAPGADGTE